MRVRGWLAALVAAGLLAGGCSRPAPRAALIQVAGYDQPIRIEFLADKAPKTVENFADLAGQGFYAGTTFHRVIPGFMIQGGDPNTKNADPRDDGMGGPGYAIPDEFSDVHHERGVVSMASMGFPNSAGSQFFILVGDAPQLDGKYTAFARVTQGLEVADAIAAVPRDARDRPLEDVAIQSITLVE